MKAASKIVRIFVVGMVITLSSLLVFSSAKAETDNQFRGYWMAWETVEEGYMYQSYTTYQNVVVVTNDPTAAGYTAVTNDSYGTDPFTRNIRFAGTYTAYERLDAQQFTAQAFPDPMHYRYGTFTAEDVVQGDTDNPETVSLSAASLQALANAISVAVGSYDDTQLLQTLDAINLLISSIDTSVSGIQTAVLSLNTVAANIYSLLQNLDNALDTISWIRPNQDTLTYATSWGGTQNNVSSTVNTNSRLLYIPFTVANEFRLYPSILHFRLRLDGNSNVPNISLNVGISHTLSTGAEYENEINYYYIQSRQSLDIFIYNTRIYYNDNNYLKLEILNNTNFYFYNSTFIKEYITSSDIEYWQLVSYFEQNKYYNSQNTELEEPNEELSQSVDDYIEQEDNLIDGFDNAIGSQDVDPSNLPDSNPANWGVEFVGSLNMIGMVFNQLTGALSGGNPVYMLMNFSLMLGLALLIIGKRG